MMLLIAIVVLGVLVFVHELGHFLVAKYYNVGVLEFAVGFGRKFWKRTIGETTYSLGLVPLGGYVRMIGDDPNLVYAKEGEQAEPASHEAALTGGEEQLTPAQEAMLKDEKRWLLNQRYWPKFAIVFAGPFFNILFAFILAVGTVYVYGKHELSNEPIIGELLPGYPAQKAGLMPGDRVLTIDGKSVGSWDQVAELIGAANGASITFIVERDSTTPDSGDLPVLKAREQKEIKVAGTFDNTEIEAISGEKPAKPRAMIGVGRSTFRTEAGFIEANILALNRIWAITEVTFRGLKGMIVGEVSTKNIGGPIFIFSEAANQARKGLQDLLDFMILLSVSLALLNLLPIPILDGGHIVFFTLEKLLGGPINIRIQQRANQVGMALLLLLMIFAISNDVLRTLGLH
jgi:regulator of sigma E protease